MAETVQATIKINMDASDVNSQIQDIIAHWNSINSEIDKTGKALYDITDKNIEKIKDDISLLEAKTVSLTNYIGNGITETQINGALEKVQELGSGIETVEANFQKLGQGTQLQEMQDIFTQCKSISDEIALESVNVGDITRERINDLNRSIEGLYDRVINLKESASDDLSNTQLDNLKEKIESVSKGLGGLSGANDEVQEIRELWTQLNNEVEKYSKSIANVSTYSLKDMQGELSSWIGALNESKTNGYISDNRYKEIYTDASKVMHGADDLINEKNQLNDIWEKWVSINEEIQKGNNNLKSVTDTTIEGIKSKISALCDEVQNFKNNSGGDLTERQLRTAVEYVQNLVDNLKELDKNHTIDILNFGGFKELDSIKNRIADALQNPLEQTDQTVNKLAADLSHFSGKIWELDSKGAFGKEFKDYVDGTVTAINAMEVLKSRLADTKEFNSIQSSINGALNEPLGVSTEQLQELDKALQSFAEKALSLKNDHVFNAEEINQCSEAIKEMVSNLEKAKEKNNWAENTINDYFARGTSAFSDNEASSEASSQIQGLNINSEKLISTLTTMASTGKITKSSIEGLGAALGFAAPEIAIVVAAITAAVAIFKAFNKLIEESIESLKNIGRAIGEGAVDAIQWFTDGLQTLSDALDTAIEKMNDFVDIGMEFQQGYFTIYNYLGAEQGQGFANYVSSLEELLNIDSGDFIKNMKGMLATVSNMNLDSEQIDKYTKSMSNFMLDLQAASGQSLQTISQQLQYAINMGSLQKRSGLAQSLKLTDKQIDQFKELNTVEERAQWLLKQGEGVRGTYSRWMNTAAGKVQQLKNAIQNLMGNIGQLALGLFAKVAPVLTALINLANKLVTSLAKVFKIDLSSAEANNAIKNNQYEKTAQDIEKVGDAAEKSQRKVASFDDIIQINDNNSKSSDLGLGDLGNFDFDSFGDGAEKANSKIQDLIDKLKELWDQGKYFEFGKTLAEAIDDWLNSIDWKSIKEKAGEIGTNLADLLNGFFSDKKLFTDLGKTLAEALNTAFTFLLNFAQKFDFTQVGVDLAAAWRGFWKNFETKTAAKAVYEWFIGIFNTVAGFLQEMNAIDQVTGLNGWQETGESIADFINTFFDSLTEDDLNTMANDVIGLINGVFETVASMLDKLDKDQIKEKIKALVTKLINGLMQNSGDWGETLSELVNFILDIVISCLDAKNLLKLELGIQNFLMKLNLGEIIYKWLKIKLTEWIFMQTTLLLAFIQTLTQFILTAGEDIKAVIAKVLLNIIPAGLGLNTLSKIGAWLADVWASVKEWWGEVSTSIINDLQNLVNSIVSIFNNLWQRIKNIGSSIRNWVNTNLIDKLNNISIKLPDNKLTRTVGIAGNSIGFKIPRLAKGGIAMQSTIANIGEAGKEAILPLENNTKWMDDLAGKLARQINNKQVSSSNNTVVLNMSGCTKNFYTRAELMEFGRMVVSSLKVYGVNVSMSGV